MRLKTEVIADELCEVCWGEVRGGGGGEGGGRREEHVWLPEFSPLPGARAQLTSICTE